MTRNEANNSSDFRVGDQIGYVLGRSEHLASARLNLQHYLWQRIFQFTVHPQIQLPTNARIADVATGTALWAIEVAQQRPDAQVEGLDIDTTQAPPPGWRPQNLSINKWDIFTDLPLQMQGMYDFAHVRLLVLVLSGQDPSPVIRRLYSLLKPGGWLQWEDLDTTHMHVKRKDPQAQTLALDAIIELSKSGGRHDWADQLPELLTKGGFGNARMQSFDDPLELSHALNDVSLMTMEEFAGSLLKMGKEDTAQKVIDLVRDGYQESLHGSTLCYPRVCCIAKKPEM